MNILAVPSNYPYVGYQFAGLFNERCVRALKEKCKNIVVLAPRPYVPPLPSRLFPVSRWQIYQTAKDYEMREGIPVHRPAYLQVPRIGSAFWQDHGAFLWCRRTARVLHRRIKFDAILSFDIIGAGGLAWRLARDLGIPASGWATGDDLRHPVRSAFGQVALRALTRLDLIFYQSRELLEIAARLLGCPPDRLPRDKHIVLSRGIAEPPPLPKAEARKRIRKTLGIADEQIVVLNVGRVVREKGVFELLEAMSLAARQNPKLTCVIVGALPAFDETVTVQRRLDESPDLCGRVQLLPACKPDEVWGYLCAADIFAFLSHKEGMPNSLLEAMAMEVPAVAFAIPPVQEIESGTGALVVIPPLDVVRFAEAILRLAASPAQRAQIGERGKVQVTARFMVQQNMDEALQKLVLMIERAAASPSDAISPRQMVKSAS